jgi:hypothetical protein
MPQNTNSHDYLILSRGQWDSNASTQDIQAAIDRFYAWYENNLTAGVFKPGSRLARDGKTVSKHSVVDGPFAEAKEVVGGYWFIVAGSLDEAAQIAAQNPCIAYGLSFEVRPLEPARASAFELASETPAQWKRL